MKAPITEGAPVAEDLQVFLITNSELKLKLKYNNNNDNVGTLNYKP